MSKFGLIIIGVLFVISNCDLAEKNLKIHKEHEHDKDEFEIEFENEPSDGNKFSEGNQDSHIEIREQTAFVQPKAVHSAKDLPPLIFLYCVSYNYKYVFEYLSEVAKKKYPNIDVKGTNCPSVAWKDYTAQAVNCLKIALIAGIWVGRNPLAFGVSYYTILLLAYRNRIFMSIMVFLLLNYVEQCLLSTGAFEIFLGYEQIWSKLETGRIPSEEMFLQLIDAQLATIGKAPASVESFGDFSSQP